MRGLQSLKEEQTGARGQWQARYAGSTYDEDGDLCRLICERAT
jgi:hypothetical protein